MIPFCEAMKKAYKLAANSSQNVFWGFLNLPVTLAHTHFSVVGSTGSGKTILTRLLMQSVIPKIGYGEDIRALVYDAKQDSMSILVGMTSFSNIKVLNLFDKRGVAWDMAKDITSPVAAQQLASILIPENRNSAQPFFGDAARQLLTGVVISFIKNASGEWSFRDVLSVMKNQKRLEATLEACEETQDLNELYFPTQLFENGEVNDTTARNIMSTIASKLGRYEFIAAAWEKAGESISLQEWLTSETVLVLGNDEAARTALDAINQVIFKRLTELVLAQSESETRKTWFFLDELRQAGRLDGLSALLTKGRSKGACVLIGYQDIEGLHEVYGKLLGNEIAGQCANKAFLRCDSADTAKWASNIFGEREIVEKRSTVGNSESATAHNVIRGSSTSGKSYSTSEQVVVKQAVLPSEIMNIAPTKPENGLQGYFLTSDIGAYTVTASGDWISKELMPVCKWMPNFMPRDVEDQYMSPWTEEDYKRLGIEFDVSLFPVREKKGERVTKNNKQTLRDVSAIAKG